MDVPASTAAVAVLVALIVPGLVYASVRSSLTGYRGTDKSLSSRFAQAVTVSVLLNAVYLAALGRSAYGAFNFVAPREQVVVTDPFAAGWTVILFGLLAPAALALLVHAVPWNRARWFRWLVARLGRWGLIVVNRVPTAWDQAGRSQSDVFLRVTRADGRVIGGFYGTGSLMSGYPEGRDVFIAQQWSLDEEGRFEAPLHGSAGLWIAVRDDDILEWTQAEEEPV